MTKQKFLSIAPKTRSEFIAKYREDYVFRNYANVYGISVVGDCVIFPNGKVANAKVR